MLKGKRNSIYFTIIVQFYLGENHIKCGKDNTAHSSLNVIDCMIHIVRSVFALAVIYLYKKMTDLLVHSLWTLLMYQGSS